MSLSTECFIRRCEFLSTKHSVGVKFIYPYYACPKVDHSPTALYPQKNWSCKHLNEKKEGGE